MHVKLLEAIGKFLDEGYITQYSIEGYYGFAYLSIPEFNVDTRERQMKTWRFNIQNDEVRIELEETVSIVD